MLNLLSNFYGADDFSFLSDSDSKSLVKRLNEWLDPQGNTVDRNYTATKPTSSNTTSATGSTSISDKFKQLFDYHVRRSTVQYQNKYISDHSFKVLSDDAFHYIEHWIEDDGQEYYIDIAAILTAKGEWVYCSYRDKKFEHSDNGSTGLKGLIKALRAVIIVPPEYSPEYKTLLEFVSLSTIDDFKLYESLLNEWVDAQGNVYGTQVTKPVISTTQVTPNKDQALVYIWDIYIEPSDKGTWCSAEKIHGTWEGYVYKTKNEAYCNGLEHLHELEDVGVLEGHLTTYTIDVVAIPKSEVSEYTLEFSGL